MNDADRQQVGGQLDEPATASRGAARTHPNARSGRYRRGLRRRRSGRLRQLIGDRIRLCRRRDLEVITATTEIDHAGVVRILENANEHPVVEALAVAAEQRVSAGAYIGGTHRGVAAREGADGPANEVKCFLPGQTLAALSDAIGNRDWRGRG
jgi:hypothetical protein